MIQIDLNTWGDKWKQTWEGVERVCESRLIAYRKHKNAVYDSNNKDSSRPHFARKKQRYFDILFHISSVCIHLKTLFQTLGRNAFECVYVRQLLSSGCSVARCISFHSFLFIMLQESRKIWSILDRGEDRHICACNRTICYMRRFEDCLNV